MSIVEVKVPDIGDFKEVEVIELMVKPGDTIKVDQSLITVESDKASMEIPSSHAGVVKELKIKVGDKVKEGSLLLILEAAEAGAEAAPATASAATAAPAVSQGWAPQSDPGVPPQHCLPQQQQQQQHVRITVPMSEKTAAGDASRTKPISQETIFNLERNSSFHMVCTHGVPTWCACRKRSH